jgi:hypothetical protein
MKHFEIFVLGHGCPYYPPPHQTSPQIQQFAKGYAALKRQPMQVHLTPPLPLQVGSPIQALHTLELSFRILQIDNKCLC